MLNFRKIIKFYSNVTLKVISLLIYYVYMKWVTLLWLTCLAYFIRPSTFHVWVKFHLDTPCLWFKNYSHFFCPDFCNTLYNILLAVRFNFHSLSLWLFYIFNSLWLDYSYQITTINSHNKPGKNPCDEKSHRWSNKKGQLQYMRKRDKEKFNTYFMCIRR